jgi:sucrose-6-phosphate hydrolase SacC (GH32 family)
MIQTAYKETYRPQFHFTPKTNWTNDPNGLIFYKGEYHLFFQHNPFGIDWGNMTWGHAVSRDLVHWKQLPHAIHPDELGTIFSGSGVVDWNNTGGFQTSDEAVLVNFYTSAGSHAPKEVPFTQSIAYSNDRGRNWTKYEGNPVIGHIVGSNRDPKVIWHPQSERWIMALYLEGNAYALFVSPNLVDWERTCDLDLPGGTEVPDFFPLAVDGDPDDVRWVFWGANTTYLVGGFDGRTFTPQGGPRRLQPAGQHYAAQTFSDLPAADGRRVMIGWMRQPLPGMPFSQFMSVPHTLHLRRRAGEPALATAPVRELETLRETSWERTDQPLAAGTAVEAELTGELLDVEATIELGAADAAGMAVRGVAVWYDRRSGALYNGSVAGWLAPGLAGVTFRVLADRASVELFAGPAGSAAATSAGGPPATAAPAPVMLAGGVVLMPAERTVRFFAAGGGAVLRHARVSRLRSAWPAPPASA